MRVRNVVLGVVLAGVVVWTGCATPTDTGLIGSWQRIDRPRSTISISRDDSGYHFRQHFSAGQLSVRCKEVDVCGEYIGGSQIYRYEYTFSESEPEGEVLLRREGIPVDGSSTPLSEVDRLTLQPGGLELHAHTIERNGEPLATPTGPYRYRKTSDRPF